MQAIILKSSCINDYDKRLMVFSESEGKIGLVARGIRKPKAKLAGHLELFNLVDLELAGKTIVGAQIIDGNQKLRQNLNKLENAFFVAELIEEFVLEGFKDNELFNLIKAWPDKDDFKREFLRIMGFAGARCKNIKEFLNGQI